MIAAAKITATSIAFFFLVGVWVFKFFGRKEEDLFWGSDKEALLKMGKRKI